MRLASLANKAEVWRQVSGVLKPPPTKTPDLWSDSGRVLPRGSAEVGRWRSNQMPYMIPIVRACTDPKYRRIIEVSASQMGKPTVYWPGPRLEGDPVLILYVGPTRSGCGESDRAPFLGDGSLV
jgi:hypothetical protein